MVGGHWSHIMIMSTTTYFDKHSSSPNPRTSECSLQDKALNIATAVPEAEFRACRPRTNTALCFEHQRSYNPCLQNKAACIFQPSFGCHSLQPCSSQNLSRSSHHEECLQMLLETKIYFMKNHSVILNNVVLT